MARQAFYPNPKSKPQGFSPATKVGKSVFVSGQVSVGADGKLVGEGNARAQAEQCFKNIEAALGAAGATMNDITKITAFVVNADDYPAYAAVRNTVFPTNGPASSTVVVKALVNPKYLIEIEAIAVLP